MRFLRRSLVGIFLLSLTVAVLAWAGNTFYGALKTRWAQEDQVRPAHERIFAVNVIQIESQVITPVLTSFGEVRSRRTLDLRTTAAGTIVALAESFEEGGEVRAGQLLVRIDQRDAQSALDVIRTDLHEAGAEMRDAGRGLELATDELASSEEQVRLREKALARQRNLQSRGVGTDAAIETAELAVSAARQGVLVRRQSIANAKARIDQANTSLSRIAISLAEAERALSETEIYAGFSGTLSEVSVVEGGLVTNNERIARIVDAGALEVAFRVSTPQYARLLDDDGQLIRAEVRISLDIPGVDLESSGIIIRESAAVGEGQTGRLLFARLKQAKGFRPGDFVTVMVQEPPLEKVALLPARAVDAASTVLVIGAQDRLEVVKTTVLRRQGDDVIVIASGLLGLKIVAERSPLLGAGIRVRPIQPATADEKASDKSAGEENAGIALPEMITLTDERRSALITFVKANKTMPAEAKARVLGQLQENKVSARVIRRIESRMGG